MRQCSSGYSLTEAVIATALSLAVMAVAFALVESSHASFAVQPEAADMQQRMRIAAGTLYNDLVMAGAGTSHGPNAGPLLYYFAPVLPFRRGTSRDDPAQTFRTDTLTLMYVPPTVAQSTLSHAAADTLPAGISVNAAPGCPLAAPQCGFKSGMDMLVYEGSGLYDMFAATSVAAEGMQVVSSGSSLTYSGYRAGTTTVAQLTNVVYHVKSDAALGTFQLVSREGTIATDVPVVDHLVDLHFDYHGDPQPPQLTGRPLSDPRGPWTTYGPPPPALLEQIPGGGYPAGENCAFLVDPATGVQVPRLTMLDTAVAGGLALLTRDQLVDGPWCPDAVNPNRWDADLLRIRRIGVTLRVQAADDRLRGPAGILFSHGGTSRAATSWLPDQTIRFQVTPRNMMLTQSRPGTGP